MKRIIFICFLLLISFSAKAYKEKNLLQKKADYETLYNSLIPHRKWVKYPGYNERQEWLELLGENRSYCIAEGEKHLSYQWQVVKATDYLEYMRSGNRNIMENIYNENLNAVTGLFIAEMAEGKGRFMDQLMNGVFQVCEMTSWSISAHIISQRAGSSFPVKDDHVLDLVSTDVGAAFSWIYYFLHQEFDKITPHFSQRLYNEIKDRILIPYMTENRFWWMAFDADENSGYVNNWNAWCNSNILQCFLLLENDPDKLALAIYRTMTSVDKYLNYNKEDGACEEGPSYWGHSAGKILDYLHILYDATGGKISLFDNHMIKNMGEYISRTYVGDGWIVNFADASARERPDYHLIARYGDKTNSKELLDFSAYLKEHNYATITLGRDAFRIFESFYYDKKIDMYRPAHGHMPYTYYPETQVCYFTNQNLFFAAKGGFNDESHNHNDVGTFNLYVDNHPVFIDIGVETYTKKTFSNERYDIWTMQSNYHNLPRINGSQQKYGKMYKATDVTMNADKKIFSLNIANAYPEESGIKKWQRTYKLTPISLQIKDDYLLDKPSEANLLHFIIWGKADVSRKGVIVISSAHKHMELVYDKSEFEAISEIINVEDIRLKKVWGNELTGITLKATKIKSKGTYNITIKCTK